MQRARGEGAGPLNGGPETEAPSEETILAELVERALAHPEDHLGQFGSLLSAHQYLRLYRLWRAHVPGGAEALDWGAGNGHFSYFLLRSGHRASGYSLLPGDYLRWMPATTSAYAFTGGDESDPVRLPYARESFDAVASIGVLEHVRETAGSERASLTEIARVLRPGGVFVCFHFPNRWSWIDWMSRRVPGKHTHPYRFTRGDIERLCAECGLTLVQSARYGVLPRNFGYRLPAPLRRSRDLARAWDLLDRILGAPLSPIAQNYCFVARKPSPTASSGGLTERNAPKSSPS